MNGSPFQNSDFRKLFAAQITSLMGSGLATVALALLAYDIAGGNAGLVLGTALAIKMVAYVTISPFAGAFTTRWDRRRMLISLDVVRALIVCMLPFVTQIWEVYILIFALNACAALFTPTYQATIPDLLPNDASYTRALSYSRLAYDIESLASPSIAAVALFFLSYDMLFAANGLTFLLSAALIFVATLPARHSQESDETFIEKLTSGTRAYLATPRLRGLLALSMALSCGGAMVIVNTVVLVRDHLGGSDTDMAMVLACYGAGSMLVALALPRWLDNHNDRNPMLLGAGFMVGSLFLGAFASTFGAVFIIWLLLGMGSSLIQTPGGRLLKRSSNEENRASIYAAQFALSHACWLVAYPIAGWAGSLVGLEVTFVLMGILALLAGVTANSVWRSDESILLHEHQTNTHAHTHVHDEHHQHDHEGWEGPEPHSHSHEHGPLKHKHEFVIDRHHELWPER